MADIVNLKRARKDKARAERENQAAANRRRFGRTRLEKAADKDAGGAQPPLRSTTRCWIAKSPSVFPTNRFTGRQRRPPKSRFRQFPHFPQFPLPVFASLAVPDCWHCLHAPDRRFHHVSRRRAL